MIELLIAMAAATVVIAALATILEVSYNQETRTADHTRANQIGRTAMNEIIDELNSSCTGIAPIQAGETVSELELKPTNATNLWLISVYGEPKSGNAVLENASEQDIQWSKTGTSNTNEELGTLTDYEFANSSGKEPSKWTFAINKANMKKRILATNVIPLQVNKQPTIFQYYHYSNGTFVEETPTSTATAEKVAKVSIGYTQAAEDADTRQGHTMSLADAVNLRLDPSESTSEGPCE